MFASAFIVGPQDGPGLALKQLSTDIGFRRVEWLSDVSEAEEQAKTTPVCYFMFPSSLNEATLRQVSALVRGSRNRQVEFAPLISFCEVPSERNIRTYLNMGFDDILVPPFHAKNVKARLELQMARRIIFFETATYFGPDRRRMEGFNADGHALRGKGGDHRRIEMVRDPNIGVKILKDERFKARPRGYTVVREPVIDSTWSIS